MSIPPCSLLVVDDEPYILSTLSSLLQEDFEVLTADSAEAAKLILEKRDVDLILSDQKMPRTTGVQLLEWVRQNRPKTVRLLMTGYAELEGAIEAINRGQIFRYIFKPWRADELLDILHAGAHTALLERSHEQLLEQLRQKNVDMQRLNLELNNRNEELRILNLELEKRVAQRTRDLEEANLDLEQKNKMLEKLALTDPLTGLPNRRAMDRLAEREIRRRERYPSALALGVIDVDHFKEINARYLLPGGDKVLQDLSKAMLSSLRNVDFLGRIGGEEFLVIAPETGLEGAQALGERIRTTVESTVFTYQDQQIEVRVSIGWAVASEGLQADYEQIREVAAAALSQAKNAGRNRCVYLTMV